MKPIDAITLEIISNSLFTVVEEAGEILVRSSYSTNIKERRDCSVALFDRRGNTLAQADHQPLHLGSLMGMVEEVVRRYAPSDLRPGDMFVGNDAYLGGGTHLPDIVLTAPIFYDGELVGFVTNAAHHSDFFDRGTRHIFEEGLRIPPVRLVREGELVRDVMDVILLNCQIPHEREGDFRAQIACNEHAIRRVGELCVRFGTRTILEASQAVMELTERRIRRAIGAVPDGVYRFEDKFDHWSLPEPLTLGVVITVRAEHMSLQFQAPDQVDKPINLVRTALLATVYYTIKALLDPEALANSGLYRPLDISAPEGSVLTCVTPAPVAGRSDLSQRVVDLVLGALAQAVPQAVTAAHNGAVTGVHFYGVDPDSGLPFAYPETLGGGAGARATKDGLDGVHAHIANSSNLPIEALEQEYPLLVERYELVNDSGGAGRYRGGLGLHRRIRVDRTEVGFAFKATRQTTAPWGLFGGQAGMPGRIVVDAAVGTFDHTNMPRHIRLKPGDCVSVYTPGGGGYGPSDKRDAALLEADVKQEKVSEAAAQALYGKLNGSKAGR